MSSSTPRIEEYSWGQMERLADHASDPAVGASLVRMVVNVGASSPKHRHDNCSEILHLLEGSVTVPIGEDDTATLSAGDTHVFSAHTPILLTTTAALMLCPCSRFPLATGSTNRWKWSPIESAIGRSQTGRASVVDLARLLNGRTGTFVVCPSPFQDGVQIRNV